MRLFHPPAEHLDAFRGYAGLDHARIDLGSEASIDMTHLLGAGIYLGAISSQVSEFLSRPRPCPVLDPHRLPWKDDPDFASWRFGPVVETIGEMAQRLATVADRRSESALRQAHALAEAFAEPDPMSAPETGTGPALDPDRGTRQRATMCGVVVRS